MVASRRGVFRGFVDGDAELDLDVPAGDTDFLDEEAEQGLYLVEVESVDAGADALGEVVDAAAYLALGDQGVSALVEAAAAVLDLGVAPLELGEVDESGLVEVDQSAVLGLGGVLSAGQSGELGVEQFIVGCGLEHSDGLLARKQ